LLLWNPRNVENNVWKVYKVELFTNKKYFTILFPWFNFFQESSMQGIMMEMNITSVYTLLISTAKWQGSRWI
jgi:hypothetical protein